MRAEPRFGINWHPSFGRLDHGGFMRVTALPTSLSAIGVLALVGAGCGPLDTWLDVQRHKAGTTTPSPSGLAGMSGSGTGAGGSAVPGTTCVKVPDGGPTSCNSYDVWKQYGTDACAEQKTELTDLVGGTACNGGYQDVTYVCCAAAPSGSTGSGGAGGGGTCTKIDE